MQLDLLVCVRFVRCIYECVTFLTDKFLSSYIISVFNISNVYFSIVHDVQQTNKVKLPIILFQFINAIYLTKDIYEDIFGLIRSIPS